ncbi:hypothetical protein K438DRAFT_1828312 [Mycena galopus ATCC 62051]|nr:hypothetical protein K438DRAFT_1828312 [Mycena galopus ATCC 62051]
MYAKLLLSLAVALFLGFEVVDAETTARARYVVRCDDDDDDDCPSSKTRSQSSSQSSAFPSSTNSVVPTARDKDAATRATVVALACIVGILIVTIAVFFLWRRFVRSKPNGVRPYIEITEEDIRPVSIRGQSDAEQGVNEDPLRHLPPVRPFLVMEGVQMNPRAVEGVRTEEGQVKTPHPSVGGATGYGVSNIGSDAPPPGYRSTEALALA